MADKTEAKSNVINLKAAREKRQIDKAIAHNRVPLGATHVSKQDPGVAERIQRIRASIEKINGLMAELKARNTASISTVVNLQDNNKEDKNNE